MDVFIEWYATRLMYKSDNVLKVFNYKYARNNIERAYCKFDYYTID